MPYEKQESEKTILTDQSHYWAGCCRANEGHWDTGFGGRSSNPGSALIEHSQTTAKNTPLLARHSSRGRTNAFRGLLHLRPSQCASPCPAKNRDKLLQVIHFEMQQHGHSNRDFVLCPFELP